MPTIKDVKLSCEACLRGHRSAVCPHTNRELFPVRAKGRPRGVGAGKKTKDGRASKDVHPYSGQTKRQRHNDHEAEMDIHSSKSRMSVHSLLEASPTSTSDTSQFNLDLDCTCPRPCPCPGCPSKSKRNEGTITTTPVSERNTGSCCSEERQIANPPDTSSHCGSCLPCVIAPFEKSAGDKEGGKVDSGGGTATPQQSLA